MAQLGLGTPLLACLYRNYRSNRLEPSMHQSLIRTRGRSVGTRANFAFGLGRSDVATLRAERGSFDASTPARLAYLWQRHRNVLRTGSRLQLSHVGQGKTA